MISRLAFAPTAGGTMGLGEELAMIERIYQPPADRQRVPLSEAFGRVLAVDLIALTDLPPFDRAAVDGYAVRKADLNDAASALLRLVGRAAAGHPFAGAIG